MEEINRNDFEKIYLVTGTVISSEEFLKAKKPAYILKIDFGKDIGIKKSSAQITDLYEPEELIGKQIIAVVNFPGKQIGPIMSECLVTGFEQDDGSVVLAVPERKVENGLRLS